MTTDPGDLVPLPDDEDADLADDDTAPPTSTEPPPPADGKQDG